MAWNKVLTLSQSQILTLDGGGGGGGGLQLPPPPSRSWTH